VAKYDLDKHVQLKARVLEAIWHDDVGKWKVKIDVNGAIKEDDADIMVNGSGFLK
jgi:hypothetical protein